MKDFLKEHGFNYETQIVNTIGISYNIGDILDMYAKVLQLSNYNNADTIAFIKWLTAKDSIYAVLYGGTPEYDKDYRFATMDSDFTIEEVFNIFKETTNI